MLSVEAERAIRAIAKIENPRGNHDAVVKAVAPDCIRFPLLFGQER